VIIWAQARQFYASTVLNPTIEIMGYEQSKIRLRGLNNLRRQVYPHLSPPFQWWEDDKVAEDGL